MKFKSRSEFNNSYDWLWYLQNDLGCTELSIQTSKRLDNGDIIFGKRYNFHELNHIDPFDKIPLYNSGKYLLTRNKIIEETTHRTILDIEIVLDIDEPMKPFKSIKSTTKFIISRLQKMKVEYRIYWTGSKSYHIHILDPSFRFEKIDKTLLIKALGGDALKASSKQLIALEGAPHYKSGIPKQEVEL